MNEGKSDIACKNDKCFACESGSCRLLTNSRFTGKPCPFYKTKRKLNTERKKSVERRMKLGMCVEE